MQAREHVDHAVVVAGGGPTGLMLAGELALAGVDVAILERRPDRALRGSRAGGLHARTIEILDQRGIAGRFLSEGQTAQVAGFAWNPLDISDFPTRHNYGLALWQRHIERILAHWVEELAVPVSHGCELTGFEQDDAGVDIALADGGTVRAGYLVGCDGGRSLVRKRAGIAFPGWEASTSSLIGEVHMRDEPEWGFRRNDLGFHALRQPQDGGTAGVMVTEREVGASGEATLSELRTALVAVYGTDYGVHSPAWISRFTDATRQAETYRKGRILLAGDAAHIHAPDGGQGLNLGVQDAANLGWKLAQVVKGTAPDALLDTYSDERHPVAARMLSMTMAAVALRRPDARTAAVRDVIADLLAMDAPRKSLAARMSGLDIRYDLGEGHALLGRRMPDLDLMTKSGPKRVFSLLHAARPVLIRFGGAHRLNIAPWADRVRDVDAHYDGPWCLPDLGAVPAPQAVLIRPDGYVAWVGEGSETGLSEALTIWVGPPQS